jgi:uncharacterized protein YraI
MSFLSARSRSTVLRSLIAFTAMLSVITINPAGGSAQSCTNCTVYAITELNLRQGPSIDSAVLRFIPAGAPVQRGTGAVTNGYAPVTYDTVPGWAVALGLVTSPEDVDPVTSPAAPVEPTPAAPAPSAPSELRVTLTPLMLRSGPSVDAEPILGMPEGSLVTLTREGAEGGYVTVDYDGVTGWAYADLLARQDEIS